MKVKLNLREAVARLCKQAAEATTDSCTRLLLACVRNGDAHQAKRLKPHMKNQLYKPNNTFFHNCLLHSHIQACQFSDARELFDRIPQKDILSYNVMLSGYSKEGSVENLREFFYLMPTRNSVSYNTLIAGLRANGYEREGLVFFVKMLSEGVEPTKRSYVSVLNACANLKYLEIAKQILCKIFISGLGNKGNVFALNALCDFYAKCGEIEIARSVFDKNVSKNLASWNLMILAYVRNQQPEKCIEMLEEMKFLGLKLDQVKISNIIIALFKIGCADEACKAFKGLEEKDKICWIAMIVGYGLIGLEENALMMFRQMILENIGHDKVTLSSVISSCAKFGSLCKGQAVHGKAIHLGVDTDLLVSNALVDMYSKCGEIMDARVVFAMGMPVRTVVSWNCMIVGCVQNGMDELALALYEEMPLLGIKPDDITFAGALSACIHEGLTEKGEEYFQSIREIYGLTPSLNNYAGMITLLCRSGHIDKAIDLIKNMPHQPDYMIWSTILSVCKKNEDVKHAKMAEANLSKLDPLNAEPDIILSNMCGASRGRSKDMVSVRSVMKNKQVEKFAAYSSVELDGKVYKFVSDDRSYPESELIYIKLGKLIRKIKKDGYRPNNDLDLHTVGEDEKLESLLSHSEKLALAFQLIKRPSAESPIRIIKNTLICGDCHLFMKYASHILRRRIILRDAYRLHHFSAGQCSCKDLDVLLFLQTRNASIENLT